MFKKFLFVGAIIAMCTTSCTDDIIDLASYVDSSSLSVSTDQSELSGRLVFTGKSSKSTAKRKASGILSEAAPSIPKDAKPLKDQPTNYNNGVTLAANGSYYVAEGETWSGSVSIEEGPVNIYIAGDVTLTELWNSSGVEVNIYVLEGASIKYALDGNDNKSHIRAGTVIKCWGKFDTIDSDHGITIKEDGALYIYDGAMEQLTIHNGVDKSLGTSLQVEGTLYCEVPVYVEGSTMFNGGNSHFVEEFKCEGNCWPKNGAEVIFESCSYVTGETCFDSGSGSPQIYVYTMFETGSLDAVSHAGGLFHLYSALLQVNGNAYITNSTLTVKDEGTDYSVFNVDSTLYVDTWATSTSTGISLTSLDGYLDIHGNIRYGNKYYTPKDGEWVSYSLGKNNFSTGDHVLFNDDTYLAGNGTCGSFGTEPELDIEEEAEVLPPSHPYSATGLDFNESQGMIYLGWHKNESLYTDTSFEGGIIDVIYIDNYDITKSIFEQSLAASEFKFNHVLYYDGHVYGAATSSKVGAALVDFTLDSSTGLFYETDEDTEANQAVRISLTGSSANCVEKVGNNFVTISGWSSGGIDIFPVTATSVQRTIGSDPYMGKYVYYNSSTNTVVTLHNTYKGTVELYDATDDSVNGMLSSPTLTINIMEDADDSNVTADYPTWSEVAIYPKDGKNVVKNDSKYIYVCCGQNGLKIYDISSGELVAYANQISANGVDVDSEYIYVAAGMGVRIYKISDIASSGTTHLHAVGSTQMETATELQIAENAKVGGSANFICKGSDGRLYVAYGVYGLRIYNISDM